MWISQIPRKRAFIGYRRSKSMIRPQAKPPLSKSKQLSFLTKRTNSSTKRSPLVKLYTSLPLRFGISPSLSTISARKTSPSIKETPLPAASSLTTPSSSTTLNPEDTRRSIVLMQGSLSTIPTTIPRRLPR